MQSTKATFNNIIVFGTGLEDTSFFRHIWHFLALIYWPNKIKVLCGLGPWMRVKSCLVHRSCPDYSSYRNRKRLYIESCRTLFLFNLNVSVLSFIHECRMPLQSQSDVQSGITNAFTLHIEV